MKVFKISLILFFFAFSLYSSEVDKVASKLQKIYEKAKDFSAEFEQASFNRTFNKWVKGGGKVYLKKGGKMRWEYTGKNAQTIVSNGKIMWVYQPQAKEVIIGDLKANVAKTPVNFLEGMGNLKKDFKVKLTTIKGYPPSKYYVLELTPREKLPNLTRMILIIKKKNMNIVEVRTYDFYENENIIKFKNIKINSNLPDSLFNFKIPAGARVMKMPTR